METFLYSLPEFFTPYSRLDYNSRGVEMTVIGGEWSTDYLLENAFDGNETTTYHSDACAKKNPKKGFVWDFGKTIELK